MPSAISGIRMCAPRPMMRKSSATASAAHAETLDGTDRDLLNVVPGARQAWTRPQLTAQGANILAAAIAAFAVLQVGTAAGGRIRASWTIICEVRRCGVSIEPLSLTLLPAIFRRFLVRDQGIPFA